MNDSKYTFMPLEEIKETAKLYRDLDTETEMQMRNGMTEEVHENYWIINYFSFYNYPSGELPDEQLDEMAELCSDHYGIPKEELLESFRRVNSWEFYDEDFKSKCIQQKL